MTDILATEFKGVRQFDVLTCPTLEQRDDNCVIDVQSDLFFCEDEVFACESETKISPELFINNDIYISHRITSAGFENWTLNPDII